MVDSHANRVVAPAPVTIGPQPSTSRQVSPPSDFFRGIFSETANSVLQGYQSEIDRKNDLIAKQRQTIQKLRTSAASMTDLIKSQSELVQTAKQESIDCHVRIFCIRILQNKQK